jgi:DNA end-binding protein Ku
MAAQLIEQYTGSFEPEKFRDTYRDALCEIINAKRKGEVVRAPQVEEAEAPTDLMAALRASVEAVQRRRAGGRAPERARGEGNGELERLSKEELYELAKEADIPGRADMSKQELVEALKAA